MGDRVDRLTYEGKIWISEESLDKWMQNFQSENLHGKPIDSGFIKKLATELHDWIPLGYEASMRLAMWLIDASRDMERYEKLYSGKPLKYQWNEDELKELWTDGEKSLFLREKRRS